MHKVNSPAELPEITYKVVGSGDDGAHVWIRKNQSEAQPLAEAEEGGFEADEVFFTVNPEKVSEAEIAADSDFWFDQMKDMVEGASGNHLGVEEFRATKRAELSGLCAARIIEGVDVSLPGGTEHFSLTERDQLNLFGKQAQIAAGATELEYHSDGAPCRYYTAEEMSDIIESAMMHVTLLTTCCNSLFTWLKACTKASEIARIQFYSEIPEEYQSEVLKGFAGK